VRCFPTLEKRLDVKRHGQEAKEEGDQRQNRLERHDSECDERNDRDSDEQDGNEIGQHLNHSPCRISLNPLYQKNRRFA